MVKKKKITRYYCDKCYQEIVDRKNRTAYYFKGIIFWFHKDCWSQLPGASLQLFCEKILDKKRKSLDQWKERKKIPRGTSLEARPSLDSSEYQLNDVITALKFNHNGLARREISEQTGIPYSSVCYRVWDHLNQGQEIFIESGSKVIEGRNYKLVKLIPKQEIETIG